MPSHSLFPWNALRVLRVETTYSSPSILSTFPPNTASSSSSLTASSNSLLGHGTVRRWYSLCARQKHIGMGSEAARAGIYTETITALHRYTAQLRGIIQSRHSNYSNYTSESVRTYGGKRAFASVVGSDGRKDQPENEDEDEKNSKNKPNASDSVFKDYSNYYPEGKIEKHVPYDASDEEKQRIIAAIVKRRQQDAQGLDFGANEDNQGLCDQENAEDNDASGENNNAKKDREKKSGWTGQSQGDGEQQNSNIPALLFFVGFVITSQILQGLLGWKSSDQKQNEQKHEHSSSPIPGASYSSSASISDIHHPPSSHQRSSPDPNVYPYLHSNAESSDVDKVVSPTGPSINWQFFRTHLLASGSVAKVLVVNSTEARVYLKPGSPAFIPYQHHPANPSYYFTIGSVDSFETNLRIAQEDLGMNPRDFISVVYKDETNLISALWSYAPSLLVMGAYLIFMSRVTGGMSGLGSPARGSSNRSSILGAISDTLKKRFGGATAANRKQSPKGKPDKVKGKKVGGSGGGIFGGGMGGPGGPGAVMNQGKATITILNVDDSDRVETTFKDVAGLNEAKQEIMEFVEYLKNPGYYQRLGAKIPKGALMFGPPGTGKTLLAKATAGEAGVPFLTMSGSDFMEMFVGVGPSRVRDLFAQARKYAPCIVFLDEIDAIGRARGKANAMGGNDERENTLNQLLVEMDGFAPNSGVVVLAGTNRVDVLDQALLRPGRFDRQIAIDPPDIQGRYDIFKVHLSPIKVDESLGKDEIAKKLAALTPGFAGANIANICNEAALVAARANHTSVKMEDFDKALDRVIGGLEKKNMVMSPEEKRIVAYHEAGHAVTGWFLEHAMPLLKVTIIPRATGALGFAQYQPQDLNLYTTEQLNDQMCMALGGRVAEEIFFDSVTTGAADDFQKVTNIAYASVKEYGMGKTTGSLAYPRNAGQDKYYKPHSDLVSKKIDDEARHIINAAYERTKGILSSKRDLVKSLAELLLKKETIDHDDVEKVLGKRPFDNAKTKFDDIIAAAKKQKSKPVTGIQEPVAS